MHQGFFCFKICLVPEIPVNSSTWWNTLKNKPAKLPSSSCVCIQIHNTVLSVETKIVLTIRKFANCPSCFACRVNISNYFCRPRMVPLRWCMLWLFLPLSSRTQKLPTRDEELFQMQIRDKAFFHDSSVIPDGAEISSYLFRDTPKRYSPCNTSFINKLIKGVSKIESKLLDLLSLDDLQSSSEWKWKC